MAQHRFELRTARQLEYETDARPVGGGVMFVEMMLAIFA